MVFPFPPPPLQHLPLLIVLMPTLMRCFCYASQRLCTINFTLFHPPPRRGSDSLVKFCPVFIFFTIRPFPGHPRVNPAPKIGFLGPVGLNSPSRYPKILKKLKIMVKNRFFGLRQNGRFLTKNGVSKKKSKKPQKIDEKSRLWTQFRRK